MNFKPSEHWYEKVADMVVREGKSLFAATNELNLGMTNRECENISRTQGFQEVLRTRRNVYYKEIANDPTLTRTATKGRLAFVAEKLIEKEQYDKAANVLMQLAKLEGWTSDGTNVSVFNELSSKDIAELRKKFTPVATGNSKDN